MVGTVWEWTRSLFDFNYPYVPDKERENLGAGAYESRVLRGGAYYSELDACRCARRYRFFPDRQERQLRLPRPGGPIHL
jgi:formylglycine-generating enzyme required for sulfatase activity